MPPRVIADPDTAPTRPQETATDNVSAPVSAELDALLDSLRVTPEAVSKARRNDLSGIPSQHREKVAAWYAQACGLNPTHVSILASKRGDIVYVKASGVYEYARGKYQSVKAHSPELFGSRTVIVRATVTLKDGSTVEQFAARECGNALDIMACATAATVRALRLALGIPLPSEGEL